MSSAVAWALGLALFGGGTLGLTPSDVAPDPVPVADGPVNEPVAPHDGHPGAPVVPGVVGAGALIALLALTRRRGGVLSPSSGLGLEPSDPLFVFVPGHGQPHGSEVFDDLIELAHIDEGSVRYFDYRWVEGGSVHSTASQVVPIDDAVTALNAYLAGLAAEGRELYLIGFSKGGATIAELIADWDDGRWGPADSVSGAALLDPPMSGGWLGWLQSVGRFVGPIPDDGGYDPVQCAFVVIGCDDRRARLGQRSGVEVLVIRNPRAAITSFGDLPDGLRVYDASDGGPGPLEQLLRDPIRLPARVAAAHESVLWDPGVAGCIVAEARRSGVCDLPRRGSPPLPGLGGEATRAPSGQKVE